MTKDDNIELIRLKFWCDAWSSTASAVNCINSETADKWADKALEAFDKRFKK